MSQRINIQYTIEMSELPNETSRLLKQSYMRLEEINKELIVPDEILSLKTLKQIDELRQNLARIDHKLNDVANIVDGYLKFSVRPDENANSSNLQDPVDVASPLANKLQEFKRSLAIADENSD